MVKVKICGITNPEDAVWVANLGADYIGLVFAKDSKRKINLAKAKEIVAGLPPYLQKVGLFVNQEAQELLKTISECKLDLIQLHGEESPEYCRRFKGQAQVIKAFRIKEQQSLEQISQYDTDFYLLDTFIEGEPGGTGVSFNWDLAAQAKQFNRPLFLAGGLNAQNVLEAIKKVEPYAVDVSSGVEASPRRKNKDLMREFIDQVRKVK